MRRKALLFLMAPLLALGMLALQGCVVAGPEYGYGDGYPVYAGYGGGPLYDYDDRYPVYEPNSRHGDHDGDQDRDDGFHGRPAFGGGDHSFGGGGAEHSFGAGAHAGGHGRS